MTRRESFGTGVTRLRPVAAPPMAIDLRSITSAATLPEVTTDPDTMATLVALRPERLYAPQCNLASTVIFAVTLHVLPSLDASLS